MIQLKETVVFKFLQTSILVSFYLFIYFSFYLFMYLVICFGDFKGLPLVTRPLFNSEHVSLSTLKEIFSPTD